MLAESTGIGGKNYAGFLGSTTAVSGRNRIGKLEEFAISLISNVASSPSQRRKCKTTGHLMKN
jgi:hypothetical protein